MLGEVGSRDAALQAARNGAKYISCALPRRFTAEERAAAVWDALPQELGSEEAEAWLCSLKLAEKMKYHRC